MANLEIEGRLVQKLAVQSGRSARGDWSKQEFILEYKEGNFPASVCFSVWGADKVRDLERFQVGDQLRVSFNAASREFNGRWYTDLRAWRIAPLTQDAPAPQGPEPVGRAADSMPAGFAPAPMRQAPAPTLDDLQEGDDLPF